MLSKNIPRVLCITVALLEQCLLCAAVRGIPNNQVLAAYNETLQLSGQMIGNDIDFTDGLTLNVFTPDNLTMTVTQNLSPLTGRYVTGDANGGLYRAISAYSWIVQTDNQAQNLIATLNIPYDPTMLSAYQIDPSNTFVAKMASDNQSWVLGEQITVNKYIFKSQVSHLSSVDGEYRLIGRIDPTITGANFADFGGVDMSFLAGGRQDVEYVDGLRMSVLSSTNLTMSVDIGNPVSAISLPQGMQSLNTFAYVINTTVVDTLNLPQPAFPSSASLAQSAVTSVLSVAQTTINVASPSSVVGASNSSAVGQSVFGTSAASSAAAPATTVSDISFGAGAPAGGNPFNGGLVDPMQTLTRIAGRFRRQIVTAAASAGQVSEGPTTTIQILASSAASSVDSSSPSSATLADAVASSDVSSIPTSAVTIDVVSSSSPSSTTAVAAAAVTSALFSNGTIPASAPTSTPVAGAVQQATIAFPINMNILMSLISQNGTSNGTSPLSLVQQSTAQSPIGISSSDADDAILRSLALQIARRDVGASNASFVPISASSSSSSSSGVTLSVSQGKLVIEGISALDGEYVILVPMAASASASGSGTTVSGSSATSNTTSNSTAPSKAGFATSNDASMSISWNWSVSFGAAALISLVLGSVTI